MDLGICNFQAFNKQALLWEDQNYNILHFCPLQLGKRTVFEIFGAPFVRPEDPQIRAPKLFPFMGLLHLRDVLILSFNVKQWARLKGHVSGQGPWQHVSRPVYCGSVCWNSSCSTGLVVTLQKSLPEVSIIHLALCEALIMVGHMSNQSLPRRTNEILPWPVQLQVKPKLN